MKYEELTKNFNPTFRVGLYGMTEEQKKQIEDILGEEFYSFYETSSVKNNELLNRPDIILTTRNDETLNEIKKFVKPLYYSLQKQTKQDLMQYALVMKKA